jgi:hypothetical protein
LEEKIGCIFSFRINNPSETIPVKDSFPNENLFAISIKSPWFVDIANYLSTGKLPPHFSPKEKQRIIRQSANTHGFKEIFSTQEKT